MLNFMKGVSHGSAALSVPYPSGRFQLHSMISSLGFSKEVSLTYDWHGLRRGDGEFALFQYTVSGRGRLAYEGREFEVLPGQAMLLHFPFDNRYWLPEGSEHWEFLYICLYGWEIMRLWSIYERERGPLVALAPNGDAVRHAFLMYESISKGRITSPFVTSEFAYRFAMYLGQEILPPAVNRGNVGFEPVKLYCKFNLHKSITVKKMAHIAGMSPYHFARQFKKSEGVPPAAYIERLQIDRAGELLRTTTHSIKEIADSCGFADPSYFTKAFKRVTGSTPKSYRSRS